MRYKWWNIRSLKLWFCNCLSTKIRFARDLKSEPVWLPSILALDLKSQIPLFFLLKCSCWSKSEFTMLYNEVRLIEIISSSFIYTIEYSRSRLNKGWKRIMALCLMVGLICHGGSKACSLQASSIDWMFACFSAQMNLLHDSPSSPSVHADQWWLSSSS